MGRGADVVDLDDVDRTQVALVGGKGARLGELSRIEGVPVPPGFCVTTEAFRRMTAGLPTIDDRFEELAGLEPDDREGVGRCSAAIRRALEGATVPAEVVGAVSRALAPFGEGASFAVRSSATAEDLPTASFAGQHDTSLGIIGVQAVLEHVGRCWASLFTERAVTYRVRNGIGHRSVHMAVVVQRMVAPLASGVLFTADPVTSDRRVVSVEATFGLGEALVSGLVDPDLYAVRGDEVVARTVASKRLLLRASPGGGTERVPVEPARQAQPVLTDAQVVRLARLGRRIEAHLGGPQDIEWCVTDDDVHIVQSRPITTLFPIPVADDDATHVYVSVGHQQMMTEAMTPLGLSVWQLTTPRPMAEAGGRLFVDVAPVLAAPATRDGLLEALGRSDPLIRDALQTVVDRPGFLPAAPDPGIGAAPWGADDEPVGTDPAIVADLVRRGRASVVAAERAVLTQSGPAVFAAIRADVATMFDPLGLRVIKVALDATWWLDARMEEWLGERSAADALARSAPGNVTSEMGLALLDVADAVRPHPAVVDHLRALGSGDDPFDGLERLEGGPEVSAALRSFLDEYGMRCMGEIDIARPRWSERPAALVPMILSDVEGFTAGAGARRVAQGRAEAAETEQDLLARLRALPGGERKAEEARAMIDRVRTFIGYREHPKYVMVSRYFVYKRALLAEADRLVQAGLLGEREDISFLRFEELEEVVRTHQVDPELVGRRRQAFRSHQSLTPPRVLTSDGEAISGSYHRDDVPAGALAGLAVSAGIVEGRARVVLDGTRADLAPGDILVTVHTDPSWSPLFVAAAGLVTEVGGRMTHGAVIAREYGLPAVVGVEHAAELIEDGQRIRVDGTNGLVELLSDPR